MSLSSYARRSRAVFAALALAAFTAAILPQPSPAATTAVKKSGAATKTVAVKRPVKQTGYHPHNGPAPADEYFGRLGMSILGVRNKVKDLGLQADTHPEQDSSVLSNALWVEDAMRDWAKKYPFDRWLPRYAYALEQMYERIPGDAAHKRALKQISYLTAYFPQTLYGRVGRAKLALGVPEPDPSFSPEPLTDLERLALLDGKVQPTMPPRTTAPPTPSPVPLASPQPVTLPDVLPSAPATSTPLPVSVPAATSAPVPSSTTRP